MRIRRATEWSCSFNSSCSKKAFTFEIGQRAATVKARIKTFATRTLSTSTKETKKIQDKGDTYQLKRSWYAIATGALIPKGPGNSQFRYLLSQAESDFIYAIIVEELGLLGGLGVLSMYLLLFFRFIVAAHKANSLFGKLLVVGLGFPIIFQAMINMGVAVGLGPITGLPLPLLSMGGTSLLFSGVAIGTILSVSKGDGQEFGPNDEILRN